MSIINPTLRQLQTPQIPMNLVQARILQQEEQKRRDEELAKIPITANLRKVNKIQAILVSSDDEDDDKEREARRRRREQAPSPDEVLDSNESDSLSPGSSLSPSLGSPGMTRPRSKTATATSASTVLVSTLQGHKQRGDRKRVEPVAIPKRLADQVEHILGRKLAGKGSVLDEREKEREEEEARKAAEPLPPIVLGQPRKRAVTSTHIQNLVSSWDHKVEEAKETTTEAERIRQFLEERSTAHAELPKPKTPLTASELLAPLPPLPPPPPMNEVEGMRRNGGRHVKGASSASISSKYGSSGYSILSASSLSSSTTPPRADSPAAKSKPMSAKRLSRSGSKLKSTTDGKQEDNAYGYYSGPELEQYKELSSPIKSSVEKKTKPKKALDSQDMVDTKRSGALLVNKAVTSRPRRTGVRGPAVSSAVTTPLDTAE
ncbi:hypothetical protein BGZ83_008696 [Gryganskiella cystojenkinii]|nr:hypothetical protein BGZ83_008696 [Gryganskiella cystojenkinii]